MEHVYAFTDEYGAFGWDLDNPSVSTHYIITSIIVSDSNLEQCKQQIENVRKIMPIMMTRTQNYTLLEVKLCGKWLDGNT